MPPKAKADNTALWELKHALRDGQLKNLYVFHGEEAYLRDIEKLIGKKIPVVRADGPSGREEIEKKVSEPKATPKPTPKPARAKEELSRAPGQKLKLEPLPPLRPLPPEPPKPRRAFRSDPGVPGRVVASADGRRGKRRGRTPET